MLQDIAQDICESDVENFRNQGFWIRDQSIFQNNTSESLKDFRVELEAVLNGTYDLKKCPVKANKASIVLAKNKPFSFDSFLCSSPKNSFGSPTARQKTIHLINIWQSNQLFKALVTSTVLGAAVVKLMGWESCGCRVAQDQVWIKPPFSGPLSYHRDTPYIDFDPKEVCTAWIPFGALNEKCGTLEYCAGSHLWNCSKRGSANQFYSSDYKALLRSAAKESGEAINLDSHIYSVLPQLGGCSFHNGNIWHGSDCNNSTEWRCGIGIHFVRGDAVLMKNMGSLWKQLQGETSKCSPNPETFPKIA